MRLKQDRVVVFSWASIWHSIILLSRATSSSYYYYGGASPYGYGYYTGADPYGYGYYTGAVPQLTQLGMKPLLRSIIEEFRDVNGRPPSTWEELGDFVVGGMSSRRGQSSQLTDLQPAELIEDLYREEARLNKSQQGADRGTPQAGRGQVRHPTVATKRC